MENAKPSIKAEELLEIRTCELHESEKRYKRLIDAVSDYIYTVQIENGAAVLTKHGPGCYAVTGYHGYEFDQDPFLWLNMVPPGDRELALEQARRAAAGEEVSAIEHRIIRKDGELRWVSNTPVLHRNDRGILFRYDGLIHDITERRQAEEALRMNAERLRLLSDNLPNGMVYQIDFGEDGASRTFTYVSAGVERLHGITAAEALQNASTIYKQVHEEDLAILAEREVQSISTMSTFKAELRIKMPSGEIHWHMVTSSPRKLSNNHIVFEGIEIDITERKQAEEALHKSETLMRTQFENSPDLIMVVDRKYRYLSLNKVLFGPYTVEELIGKDALAPLPEHVRGLVKEKIDACFATKVVQVFEHEVDEGNWVIARIVYLTIDANTESVMIISTDITGQKMALMSLHESEERLRLAHKATNDVVWDWDIVRDDQTWNEAGAVAFGWTDIVQQPQSADWWVQRVHPEDRQRIHESFFAVVNDPSQIHWQDEYRFLKAGGDYAQVLDRGYVLRNAQGKAVRMIGAMLDITERKRAEEALRESQQRLNLASRSAKLGIWDWDIMNDQMIWDDEMFRLYGLKDKPAAYGLEIWDHSLHPDDKAQAMEDSRAALRGEKDYDTEFRVIHNDGTVRHIKANGLVLRNKEGNPIRMLGVNYDITEHKKAEESREKLQEQLRQVQRMEAIGQLAGGIAHDFNNILAAIMMNIGLAETYPVFDPRIKQMLKEIQSDASRAANLTRQLLLFSRRSVMNMKILDINDVVAGMLKMLERLIGENINLQFNRSHILPAIKADAGMIEQVLMNLVVNSRDAMPKGGKIAISTEVINVSEERVQEMLEVEPGQFICLAVSDTGCGMNEDTRKHIFEPFFTTKEPGKGTGLGLATVYGIVTQHHGWVEVISETGKGATFRVYLPASQTPASNAAQSEKDAVLYGNETILLVEDAQGLRQLMAQGLRLLGYQVIEAGNGQEALQIWQDRHPEIDMLFTDMVMPEELTGLDLVERFRELKPNLKVIISSGYNLDIVRADQLAASNIIYMQKPYKIGALAKAIRDSFEQK